MKLSRRVSWFLAAFGVWSWIVWTTFVKNLWKDSSGLAFHNGSHAHPTAYFWIHLTLAIVSFLLGTAIGLLGVRGLLALRREGRAGEPPSGGTDEGATAGADGGPARAAQEPPVLTPRDR
nr:hypothetical protein [Streptomyces sp. HPF1205]